MQADIEQRAFSFYYGGSCHTGMTGGTRFIYFYSDLPTAKGYSSLKNWRCLRGGFKRSFASLLKEGLVV